MTVCRMLSSDSSIEYKMRRRVELLRFVQSFTLMMTISTQASEVIEAN